MTDLLARERGLDPQLLEHERPSVKPVPAAPPTCRVCGLDVEVRRGELVHLVREAEGGTTFARSRVAPYMHEAVR